MNEPETTPSIAGLTGSTLADPFLRIRADKVTHLLDLVGELGLAALAVTHHPALEALDLPGFENAVHRLELLIHEAQDIASSLRLVPVGQVFHRMQRVVRDLAHQTGKQLEIVLEGEDVEIDKAVVDQLNDPLVHLVRNAAGHGLETPAERKAAGKPAQGRITLAAVQRGREIHISVADDGRGLNRAAILKRAREVGLPPDAEEPDEQTVWSYVFQPGFSTSTEITHLAGRGVGLDVVQKAVQALRGRVEVDTRAGQGTRIIMAIPLTLAFLESMVLRSGNQLYAIPIEAINEVFQPEAGAIKRASAEGQTLVMRQGNPLPLYWLNVANADEAILYQQVIVAVHTARGVLGLPMDEIVGQQQVVMKPLQGHLRDVRGGAGCALLSSGEIAIALDVERLVG
jgi:two-component system chemotaxis sensor kinase CheA